MELQSLSLLLIPISNIYLWSLLSYDALRHIVFIYFYIYGAYFHYLIFMELTFIIFYFWSLLSFFFLELTFI